MGKKTRSARGELVDFDLLKIKSQIASAPKPLTVKKREDFIDKKARRRLKKVKEAARQAAHGGNINIDPVLSEDTSGDKE